MKAPIITLLICTLFLTSCKDSTNSENESLENSSIDKNINYNTASEEDNSEENNQRSKSETIDSEIDPSIENSSSEKSDNTIIEKPITNLSGNFIKIGDEMDNSCSCYCLDVNYNGNSELCLTPSKMYIDIRMVKASNNLTNIFLVAPSSKNTEGKDIPWAKFDKNTPIATITPKGNGEIELDWLGFTMNGDLAIDYAILGKKTLEGNYKKK